MVTIAQEPIIGVWKYSNSTGFDERFRFNANGTFVESFYFDTEMRTAIYYGTWRELGGNTYTLDYTDTKHFSDEQKYIYDPVRNAIYNPKYAPFAFFTPYQGDVSAASAPLSPAPVSATITQSPSITPERAQVQISDAALKALIQDAKNKLDQSKESSKADTIILSGNCKGQISKELGYLIDVTTGDMFFVKGDYGFIYLDIFIQNMTQGHTYILLHTHPIYWYSCDDWMTITYNTFSLSDLALASNLTEQGYHVQKVIAVGDRDYEVYPKLKDDWRTNEEVYKCFEKIEQRMEVKFSTYDPYWNRTYYHVDSIMPLLAKELNYTYSVNHVVQGY